MADAWRSDTSEEQPATPVLGFDRRDFLRRLGLLAAGTGLGAWRLLDWAWPEGGCGPKDPCDLQLAALHVSGTDASAVLVWQPPADLSGFWKYWVMRRAAGESQFARIATIRQASRTSFVDGSISLGGAYEYQVWNVARAGRVLGTSNLLPVQVGAVLGVPSESTTSSTTTSSTTSSTTTTTVPEQPAAQTGAPGVTRQVTGFQASGFEVPAGETWEVVGTVETPKNVLVRGTLRMRPGSTLRFVGVDETRFVGGGMDPVATDVGLWVVDAGMLDIQGTPRAGWNRTGTDPTWQPGDEVLQAPTSGWTFQPFTPGSPVPRAYPDVPPTEVLNLTRDVVIEGTPGGRSHIKITSTRPQLIRHCVIRHMGPTGVLGRYPLHFHMCEDGSRGSVVEGVVVRDCGNHAFVPHVSHGITFRDCIAYNVLRDAYWWDPGDWRDPSTWSNDIRFEHCLAALVKPWDAAGGGDKFRLTGFQLQLGTGNACVDCTTVAVTTTNGDCSGFHWPEFGSGRWLFKDCVAHQSGVNGIFVWDNNGDGHLIENFVAYNCGVGIDHGAYVNGYVYRDVNLVGCGEGIFCHADAMAENKLRFERPRIRKCSVGVHKGVAPVSGSPVVVCAPQITEVSTRILVDPGAESKLVVPDTCG
jgi:hypothetical protein